MKKYKVSLGGFIAASIILLILTAPLRAESPGVGNNVFSIGPRIIYSNPKDADTGQMSAGAQARLHLSLGSALECSLDSRSNNFNNSTTIKTWPFQVSLLGYIFPGAVWSPYLLGGAGWYYTEVDGPFSLNHTDSRFGLHAGIGLEYVLERGVSVDISYRYIWLENIVSEDANALLKNYQDSGDMITIALNFLF